MSGNDDAEIFQNSSGRTLKTFPTVDVFTLFERGGRSCVVAHVRVDSAFASRRLAQHEADNSVEEFYRAESSIIYDSKKYRIECYVKIPPVQRNVVGILIADEVYIATLVDQGCFNSRLSFEILEVNLIEKVDHLPDWKSQIPEASMVVCEG